MVTRVLISTCILLPPSKVFLLKGTFNCVNFNIHDFCEIGWIPPGRNFSTLLVILRMLKIGANADDL